MKNKALILTILLFVTMVSFSQKKPFLQTTLIKVNVKSLDINRIESYYYRFEKGQPGAEHFHLGPVFGYVIQGQIIYQIENEKPVILEKGESFYEPADRKITRFDNGSKTEEAIFMDLSLLSGSQPAIKFEKQPTEKYDIKLLQQQKFDININQVVVSKASLLPNQKMPEHKHKAPVIGFVIKGSIRYKVGDGEFKIVKSGEGFYEPEGENIVFENPSETDSADYINFFLLKKGQTIPNIIL